MTYTPKEVCKIAKVTYDKLRYLDKIKKVVAMRNEKNRRYYTEEQLALIKKIR